MVVRVVVISVVVAVCVVVISVVVAVCVVVVYVWWWQRCYEWYVVVCLWRCVVYGGGVYCVYKCGIMCVVCIYTMCGKDVV